MAIDFPSSPTTNQTVTVGSKTWVYDGAKWNSRLVTSVGPTGPQGASANRNVILNSAFEINQRNFSSSTAGGYGFDRWTTATSGGTCTASAQTFTPGSGPAAGIETRNFYRIVTSGQSATGNFALLIQNVEDVRTFAGQTVTLSFYAKAGSGTPKIAGEFYQYFGTGGSPSGVVETPIGASTISTSWARYSLTFVVPSITGKTIGTNNDSALAVNLWVSSGATFATRSSSIGIQNNTFDIWGVQVEAGATATAFQRNAPSIQAELAACQRYYWRQTSATASDTYYGFATGFANSTTSAWISPFFPVQMRIAPSFSSSAASTFQMFNNGGIINATSTALGRSGVTSATINIGAASGLVANAGLTFEARNTTAAFLEFSAEL